jgi:hypothetical protein
MFQKQKPDDKATTMELGPVIRTKEDFARRFNVEQPNSENKTKNKNPDIKEQQNPFVTKSYSELKFLLQQLRHQLTQVESHIKSNELGESINQIREALSGKSSEEVEESRTSDEETTRRNAQKIPSDMWNAQLKSYREAQELFSKNPYNTSEENREVFDEFARKIDIAKEVFSERRETDKKQTEGEDNKPSMTSNGLKGFMGRVFGKK